MLKIDEMYNIHRHQYNLFKKNKINSLNFINDMFTMGIDMYKLHLVIGEFTV